MSIRIVWRLERNIQLTARTEIYPKQSPIFGVFLRIKRSIFYQSQLQISGMPLPRFLRVTRGSMFMLRNLAVIIHGRPSSWSQQPSGRSGRCRWAIKDGVLQLFARGLKNSRLGRLGTFGMHVAGMTISEIRLERESLRQFQRTLITTFGRDRFRCDPTRII